MRRHLRTEPWHVTHRGTKQLLSYSLTRACYLQHPERLLLDLSTLSVCSLPVSQRCSEQAAKCLRPAYIPVLLGGAGAHRNPRKLHRGRRRQSERPCQTGRTEDRDIQGEKNTVRLGIRTWRRLTHRMG